MTVNSGLIDRVVIWLALTACAVPIGFTATGWNWLGWIGIVPLATEMFGFCPLYSLIGVPTCPVKRTE